MTEQSGPRILGRLGLPSPSIHDAEVIGLYEEFAATLREAPDGSVIFCHSGFFDLREPDEGHTDAELDLARLKLLGLILDPEPEFVDQIASRLDTMVGSIAGTAAVEAFGAFKEGAERARSRGTSSKPRTRVLFRLLADFSFSPAHNWFEELQVASFGESWAVILYQGDWSDDWINAFPKILGFARLADRPLSVATVLALEDRYWIQPASSIESEGCGDQEARFYALCWTRDPEQVLRKPASGFAEFLIELSPDAIQRFLDETAALTYDDIRVAIDTLRDEWSDPDSHEIAKPSALEPLARLIEKREREDEERYRIPRKLWFLEDRGNARRVEFGLEEVASAIGGLSPEEVVQMLGRALDYSEPAARGAVAVVGLRLHPPSVPPDDPSARAHPMARALRTRKRATLEILTQTVSEDDARRILWRAAKHKSRAVRSDALAQLKGPTLGKTEGLGR